MERTINNKGTTPLTICLIIGLGMAVLLMKFYLPAYYTPYLLLIPAYFLLLGMGMILFFSYLRRKKLQPGRELALLMVFNVGRMALSFSLLFCYYRFIQVQKYTVLIVFCIFYLFFMGINYYIQNRHQL